MMDNVSMFRLLFERSADAMTLQDPLTGAFLDVNEASVRLTGAPNKEALLGSSPGIISPERQPDGSLSSRKVESVIREAMEQGSHRFEWMITRFDGTQLPVEIVLTLIRGGKKPLLLSVSRDITERKQAEEKILNLNSSLERLIAARTAELTASEARLRTIVDHAPEAIVVFDGDTARFLSSNVHAQELYGCTAEELTRLGPANVSPEFQPDGRRSADAARVWIDQAISGKTPVFEWLHQQSSGRIVPTEVRLVRLPAEGKNLLRASITDITEHKRIEAALRRRGEQMQKHRDVLLKLARSDKSDFDKALRTITSLAASTMDVARVSYWSLQENDSALVCEVLHLESEQGVDEQFRGTRLGVADAPAYFAALSAKKPIAAGDVFTHPAMNGLVESYLKPRGITSLLDVPVWVRGEVVGVICHEHIGPAREWSAEEIDFASSLAAMVSLALEESHRARSERLLRESEEKFRALFEASSQGVMLHDEFQYLEVNSAMVQILGYDSARELIGLHPSQTSPPVQPNGEDSATLAKKHIQECLSKGHVRFEWVARRKSGEDIPIEVILTRVQWGGKQIIQAAVNEISQRKQAEAELLKSLAREKELGQLKSNFVSMVSHEFRTPLGVIMSSAEILENYLDQLEPEDRCEQLKSIQKNTRRMADLMEEVLVLGMVEAGTLDFNPAELDFASFCRRIVDELQSATNNKCLVQISLPDDVKIALADERLLQHVFTNLLSNAVKYSPAGSTVHFDVERGGDNAVCRIRDHGMGIPEADIERLFSAFYRGRNASLVPGTGLGLTIVKRCVELHRGKIIIESAVDQGTTVTVKLPLFATNHPEAK